MIGDLSSTQLPDVELPERYRLLRHIADGGMGSVFAAQDASLSRKVAVKVLAPQFQHDPRAVRRFAREARAAARLSGHRNIVTIYDVGGAPRTGEERSAGPAFIVMEYLACGTVADALRTGGVSVETARRWIGEAASALDYAHGRGVVHGDIKPGNLLLDARRSVRIADFGIARIASDGEMTSSGQLFGTASYVSPEQALGDRAIEASDRYALAVVAFELLAGEKPFSAEGPMGLVRQHIEQQPPAVSARNPALPRGLDRVLQRGMAKRPDGRWPTATAFAEAIDAALSPRRVAFGGSPAAAPTGNRRRTGALTALGNRPRTGAVAALAAVALLAGVAFGANQGGPATHRDPTANSARPHSAVRPAPSPARRRANQQATPKPAAQTSTPMTPPTTTTPAASSQPTSAASLEARGHSMMLAGNYSTAIPLLQHAMESAPTGSLLYQWSMFDLAHSYREVGDLVAAIPLLQERLRYPDQRPVVQQELSAALGSYRQGTPPDTSQPPGQGPSAQDRAGRHKGHGSQD